MKRLIQTANQDINEGCTDEFICTNRGKGKQLSINDFRKYIAVKFENELKAIPGLYEEIIDYDGEPQSTIKLYIDVFTDFCYELDSDDLSKEIEENLKENYMHDYLMDIAN
jgi:hypothetical protein